MKPPVPVRIILDVNVVVSGLISRQGVPGLILDHVLKGNTRTRLVMSKEIFAELKNVLSYSSVRKYLKKDIREIDELITDFELISEIYETSGHNSDVKSRDPDDDKYLVLAEMAKPDFLVSGDSDLTDIRVVGVVRIVTPRIFWNVLTNPSPENN
ncbi:MAG: putative toxin-antitoxin system toxin component, PIN family [Victivallales bacterium]